MGEQILEADKEDQFVVFCARVFFFQKLSHRWDCSHKFPDAEIFLFFVVCIDFLGSSKLCLKTHEPVRWMDGFGPEKSPPRYLLSESMIDTPLLYYSSKVVR